MDDKTELTLSINEANSLKLITTMNGWNIVEKFLNDSEAKYDKELKDENNDDMANVKACRKILKFIKDFRDLLRYKEISASIDEQELKRIERGK